ncbi:toll/interleukin-1 receptor domain-containing protein [Algihabitans sp.]|uniref:toll/interleukin-1 receptor domain-containing protein n=1 Tax=Algihabitans sp. TaxID=2821514 RepID=UPI003BA96F17
MKYSLDGKWDLFISHASEDKIGFVQPLVSALSALGVNVWYDEFELKAGDSLSRSIDKGLLHSSFGIVVLSPAFFSKNWPEYELRGLNSKEIISGNKVIIPIWHRVNQSDVLSFSPSLADKFAIQSEKMTPVQIAVRVIEIIRPDLLRAIQNRILWNLRRRLFEVQEIPLDQLKKSPLIHKELPDDLVGRVRFIRAALLDVFPDSIENWIDGFLRDAHPSTEVGVWEGIVTALLELQTRKGHHMSGDYKREALRILLSLSVGVDYRRVRSSASAMSVADVDMLVKIWVGNKEKIDFECFKKEAELNKEDTSFIGAIDKERFPEDFPEELISELLRSYDFKI